MAKHAIFCSRKLILMKIYFTLLFSFFAFFAFAQPVNDDCSGIIDLGEAPYCSDPAEYTNINATASDIDPVFNIPACFSSGGVQRDVWFQFTVPASGTLVDFTILVNGNTGGNGTLKNPQIPVYRGDCAYGQLNELACASAANGVNSISLDVLGLTPGLPYFIRVNDYSATATPNSGTFQLCVNEFVPNYIIGETASTTSCSGTLLDSGGETRDYTSNENLSFSICPQDFHQCIVFNLVDYNTEENFDFIHFIQGADVTGIEVFQISGSGTDLEVQISGDCATVQFTSDISAVDAGFVLTWECSPSQVIWNG